MIHIHGSADKPKTIVKTPPSEQPDPAAEYPIGQRTTGHYPQIARTIIETIVVFIEEAIERQLTLPIVGQHFGKVHVGHGG
jgi:hypothetical protein